MHYFVSFLVLQSSWRGRESWLLCFACLSCIFVAVDVLWLFLTVPWVGLQCIIVVFPDHTHLHFVNIHVGFSLRSGQLNWIFFNRYSRKKHLSQVTI